MLAVAGRRLTRLPKSAGLAAAAICERELVRSCPDVEWAVQDRLARAGCFLSASCQCSTSSCCPGNPETEDWARHGYWRGRRIFPSFPHPVGHGPSLQRSKCKPPPGADMSEGEGTGQGGAEGKGRGRTPSPLPGGEVHGKPEPLHDTRSHVSQATEQSWKGGGGAVALVRQFYADVASNERLLAISVSTSITAMCHTALGPVLPIFAKGFGVSAAAIGMTVSAFALARLVLNLPSGMLADRIGRRPLLVVGPVITSIGMIGSGFAWSFHELLAWRFLTGVGSAMQMSGSQLFLADSSSTANRARMLGTNQVAGLLGVSLGPAVGGLLADTYGMTAPFVAVGCASAASALYAVFRLPETHPGILKGRSRDAQGVPGSQQKPHDVDPGNPGILGRAQEYQDTRQEGAGSINARLPGWQLLLGCPNFRAIALINCVLFTTVNGTRAVLMPLMGAEAFGMTPSSLGCVFASMAALNILGVLPAAAAADKFGRKLTIVPAGLGLGMSLMLMSCAASLGQQGFWASALVFATMNSAIGPSPAAYAADIVPKRSRGLGLGLYRSAGDLGLLVGPPLLGAIADVSSPGTAMAANAVMLILASTWFGLNAREVKQLARHPCGAPKNL